MEYNASSSGSNDEAIVNVVEAVCNPYVVPSVAEYFAAFNVLGLWLFSLGGVAVFITVALFADTIRSIIRTAPINTRSHAAFVVSVYPVVAIVTFCATLVPRAQVITEAVSQGMFMCSMYQLFCLIVSYGGGETGLVKKLQPAQISLQVAPCCCWSCCSFLPVYPLTKERLKILRALVVQLPVVQAFSYIAMLVMWSDDQKLYPLNYNYYQPVVVTSILLGIWGMVMLVRVSQEGLKEYFVQGKFIVLQLVLLLTKFQGLAARTLAMGNLFPCRSNITPTVYTNLIYNSALLWEMVLLAGFARLLYQKPVPESYQMDKNSNLPKQLCTLQEKITISESITQESVKSPVAKY